MQYLAPSRLDEALLLNEYPDIKIIAGGTDVSVSLKEDKINTSFLLDITKIKSLKKIEINDGTAKLGPILTCNDIISNLVYDKFQVLIKAASLLGGPQVRYMATIGGNLGSSLPSGDLSIALLSLDASLKLASIEGNRFVKLSEFFIAPGVNILKRNELISEITFEIPYKSRYERISLRKSLALPILSVAISLKNNYEGNIALGPLAEIPYLSNKAKKYISKYDEELIGKKVMEELSNVVEKRDSIRASTDFRLRMVEVLVSEALKKIKNDETKSIF